MILLIFLMKRKKQNKKGILEKNIKEIIPILEKNQTVLGLETDLKPIEFKKLLEKIINSIENVKKFVYIKTLLKLGSPFMYAMEYMCTKKEIKVTMKAITIVKLSISKPISKK